LVFEQASINEDHSAFAYLHASSGAYMTPMLAEHPNSM
jgi:hypothetical protein